MSSHQIPEYTFREEYEQLGFEVIKLKDFYTQHSVDERANPHRLKFYALIYITKGKDTHLIDFTPHIYKTSNYGIQSRGGLSFIHQFI